MSVSCESCKFKNLDEAKFCGKCGCSLIELDEEDYLNEGYILDKRYEIIGVIKEGGMGCVYKARDIRLDSICAVKEMLFQEEEEEDDYSIKRFKSEALLLSRLRHIGLPVVTDYFIENGRYYIVMDYIKGYDIQTVLESLEGRPMEEDQVINCSVQTLEVLEYLHIQDPQIIYRDLKPGNIMVREHDKRVMLVDFGIARTIKTDSDTTKTSIGTFGYCPIEQVKGRPEVRSDIYSMGATMHHMLTGVQPAFLSIEPLEKLNPNVSRKLMRIVNKAIHEKLDNRFSSADEMREALLSSEPSVKIIADEYPDMIYIPPGEFWMGNEGGDPNEFPVHKLFLQAFLIDKHPVTNGQFDAFIRETGHKMVHWRRHYKPGTEDVPVVNLSWSEALMYAEWAGKKLPSEVQWEKAARGTDRRKYPWGDDWGTYMPTGINRVGSFPDRASPYGVLDLVGSTYEWTDDWYHPYPYSGPYKSGKTKVVKGGKSQFSTCSYRGFEIPEYRSSSRGFRCIIEF